MKVWAPGRVRVRLTVPERGPPARPLRVPVTVVGAVAKVYGLKVTCKPLFQKEGGLEFTVMLAVKVVVARVKLLGRVIIALPAAKVAEKVLLTEPRWKIAVGLEGLELIVAGRFKIIWENERLTNAGAGGGATTGAGGGAITGGI